MSITPQIEQWLEEAGYQYHCFISYPHIQSDEMLECADRVRGAIESELALLVPEPRVFLDRRNLIAGDVWDPRIRHALCHSIAMVAICAPIYYHPHHRWCGLEWAAMDKLSELRLGGEEFCGIIPVIFRHSKPLPERVSRLQYVDISRVSIQGRGYYNTKEFRSVISTVVTRIEEVATAIAKRLAITNCDEFQFPDASAFGDQPISAPEESFWKTR